MGPVRSQAYTLIHCPTAPVTLWVAEDLHVSNRNRYLSCNTDSQNSTCKLCGRSDLSDVLHGYPGVVGQAVCSPVLSREFPADLLFPLDNEETIDSYPNHRDACHTANNVWLAFLVRCCI